MIYLDASAIMRLIEGETAVKASVQKRVGSERPCTSIVRITECLTKPLRDNNESVIASYEEFFSSQDLTLVEVTRSLAEVAASVRANFRLKTPDALHFATAIALRCSRFASSDRHFISADGYQNIVIDLLPASSK